ncbi:ComEC/Rec2 family competence protein [Clostridium tarantellae]|uniref:ComEC/Rec2 family competence protein n=1 Tax=Clostridium tarantellae TaxID=39493 RepID=A0A6I1MMW4_9CLOT|nr:ComEC/Rec2 family competence protein [Clostridium tarantellae]MPQ42261.1 ComEC/Rec2 family competence protein [Clostridium tarantellae]
MKINIDKLKIDRPLVLIIFSVILGNLIYCTYENYLMGAVLIAVLIFLIYFFILDIQYFVIGIIFIVFSSLTTSIYYGIQENENFIYTLRVSKIYENYSAGNLRGRNIKIYGEDFKFEEGEVIKVKGKFKKEIDLENGVIGNIFIENIIERKQDFIYKLVNISKEYNLLLNKYFSKGESALLTSLAFGDKSKLSYGQKEYLKELGIIHLICISGFHLNLIFSYIYKIFSLKVAIIICAIYVLITGLSPSALRAFFMIVIIKSSTKVYKTYDNISGLSLSAIILLLYKPYNLYDVGFNLSYLGTLGIILFYNKLKRLFYKLPNSINSFISVSLAAQVFIYPYMILKFNSFSLNFLLAGAILTPIISFMLPLSLLLFFFYKNLIVFKLIFFITKLILLSFKGALILLDKFLLPMSYSQNVLAIIYILMLGCFYMAYNGFQLFKKFIYMFIPIVIMINYTPNISFQIYNEKWNKALIIKSGFRKVAITNSNNKFFYDNLGKNFFVSEINNINEDVYCKIGKKYFLYLDKSLSKSYLMLINKEYDIIPLTDKEVYNISFFTGNLKKTEY